MSKDQLLKDNLFYSQITFAMNSARIIKTIALSSKPNRTEFQILHNSNMSMIINSAKLWDKTHYSLEKFVNRKNISEEERQRLVKNVQELRVMHGDIIENILSWRHELVAHLSDKITIKDFKKFNGDIKDIQTMLKDVSAVVQSASWYPESKKPMKFLDYTKISKDLRI